MSDPARYVLTSTWSVDASVGAVWAVFEAFVDAPDPFAWWPDLVVRARDDDVVHVVTRSALGYRLRFRLHSLWTAELQQIGFAADGDLRGSGTAVLAAAERGTTVRIEWVVAPTRTWMRWTTPLLRPVYVAAHRRVMRRGELALQQWLAPGGA